MDIYEIEEGAAPSQNKRRYAVLVLGQLALPGVICPQPPEGCGATWGYPSFRVFKELPEDHLLRSMSGWPVALDRFKRIVADVRRTLDLPLSVALPPGAAFGPMTVKMCHGKIVDLSSPNVGALVITERFRQFLVAGAFTGWRTESMNVLPGRPGIAIPLIHELIVEGRGGAAITQPPRRRLSLCPQCGREKWDSPFLEKLEMDENSWDGSDFFRFDPPFHGYVFVAKRLADALRSSDLTNIQLRDTTELIQIMNQFATS